MTQIVAFIFSILIVAHSSYSAPTEVSFDPSFQIANFGKQGDGNNGEFLYFDRTAKHPLKIHWNQSGETTVTFDSNASFNSESDFRELAKSIHSTLSFILHLYSNPPQALTHQQNARMLTDGVQSTLKIGLAVIEELETKGIVKLKNKDQLAAKALECLEKILDPRRTEFTTKNDDLLMPQRIWQSLEIVSEHIHFFDALSPRDFLRLLYSLTTTEDEWISAFTKRFAHQVLVDLTIETRWDFMLPIPGNGFRENSVNAMWNATIRQYCEDIKVLNKTCDPLSGFVSNRFLKVSISAACI